MRRLAEVVDERAQMGASGRHERLLLAIARGAQRQRPRAGNVGSPTRPASDETRGLQGVQQPVDGGDRQAEFATGLRQTQSTSVGVSGSYCGITVGASGGHSKSSADAQSQMANCSCKISFDCMRVDIGRSWLRSELFFDDDLQVAPGQL